MQTFFSEGKGPGIRYDDFNLEFKLRLTDCIACKKTGKGFPDKEEFSGTGSR